MLRGRSLVNRPNEEIAESFSGSPVAGAGGQLLGQDFKDSALADILGMEAVQPLAVEAAAEPQIILAGPASGQSNLGDIGTRTAVRAAAHADSDRFFRQAVLV